MRPLIELPSSASLKTNEATYYDYFLLDGKALGATRYIRFLYDNTDLVFIGKILTVFVDHENNNEPTAEIQLFPYAPKNEQTLTKMNEENHIRHCYSSQSSMEISLNAILSSFQMIYIPPSITQENILKYIEDNRFVDEHSDNESGFDLFDDDQEECIGYFMYDCDTKNTDGIDSHIYARALPPALLDEYFSFKSQQPIPWYNHGFVHYLKRHYFDKILDCIVPSANKDAVFNSLNHSSYKIEVVDTMTKTIIFRRTKHTVSNRQLKIIFDLRDSLNDLRSHNEDDTEHDGEWLRSFYNTIEKIKRTAQSYLD